MFKKGNVDLLNGNIAKAILIFSIPLLIGNLFQQLYNTVDSYVVGNYVGKAALAAVGASSPIINMLVGFFMGMATGAGVVISQYFGASDKVRLQKSVHTSIALTIVLSIVLTTLGVTLTDPLLHWIGVPDDIFAQASIYLKIYFAGITFILFYNMGAGILRAIGDSTRPLIFLAITSVVNVILDLIFVRIFHMGVAGVGYATLLSQAISAILVLGCLIFTKGDYRLNVKYIRFDKDILRRIVLIGFPSGFQQSIVSLSNVVVQYYINAFGSSVVAGFTVVIRIDGFINLPLQSFSMAITTFVGQNIGAGKYDRVKKGIKDTLIMSTIIIGCMVLLSFLFGKDMIAFFNRDIEVIEAGRTMQLAFLPFYLVLPISQVIAGALRGVGKSAVPMYIMIFNYVLLRQVYLAIVTKFTSDVVFVFLGWSGTWAVAAIMFIIYYYKVPWLKTNSLEN